MLCNTLPACITLTDSSYMYNVHVHSTSTKGPKYFTPKAQNIHEDTCTLIDLRIAGEFIALHWLCGRREGWGEGEEEYVVKAHAHTV